jgi:exonuclease VII large subunit
MTPTGDEPHLPTATALATTEDALRAAVPDQSGGASLEKVRDILFGGPLREVERRFARLEERLARDTSDLRDEVRQRLDALERFIKLESETLAGAIKSERDDRSEAAAALSNEIKESARAQERRASAIDEQQSKGQRELRQQMLEQHQRLTEDIRQKMEDVLATIARETHELRNDKTDRTALASLLTEMAMRLTNEFKLPGVEDGHA